MDRAAGELVFQRTRSPGRDAHRLLRSIFGFGQKRTSPAGRRGMVRDLAAKRGACAAGRRLAGASPPRRAVRLRPDRPCLATAGGAAAGFSPGGQSRTAATGPELDREAPAGLSDPAPPANPPPPHPPTSRIPPPPQPPSPNPSSPTS